MKKFAKIAMAASVFMMPFAANAAPSDGLYKGTVDVSKGLFLTCTMSATVTTSSGGNITISGLSLSPGNLLCGLVSFTGQPYTVTHVGGNVYKIHDVEVTTITPGNCQGDIDVVYDAGPPEAIHLSGILPPDCSVNGTLIKQ